MILQRRILVALVIVLLASVASYITLGQYFSRQEASQTQKRAVFFAQTIDDALRRLNHLPFVIAQNPVVAQALETKDGTALNPLLKTFASRANASQVFLMDLNGKTLSASNYQTPESFIGNFYTFRPYFRDALEGKTGQLFAIGVTTGEPGYFVSEPVRNAQGTIIGVVVVKIDLGNLARSWQASGERILVTNSESVVLLASKESDQFRTLAPLSEEALREMADFRLFGDRPLLPLDWQVQDDGRVTLNGADHILAQASIEQENWTVHLLTSLSGIRQRTALAVVGILAVLFAIILAVTGFRSARLKQALAKSDADRMRLTREVNVRRVAETRLKAAKDELARSSRLAALGQLSASITHELGQPIAAMRNYLTAQELAEGAAPGSVNKQLTGLVDRMENINNQLRFFATPRIGENAEFDLRSAADAAVELVSHGVNPENTSLEKKYSKDPVPVSANKQRVEQVLVNLLRNAIDAVADQDLRRIIIEAGRENGHGRFHAFVRVTDTGPGLEGRTLAELQEPFMTTKSSGQGMGLGLAISSQIASDLNGTIEADAPPEGGARFTLTLPLSQNPTEKPDE